MNQVHQNPQEYQRNKRLWDQIPNLLKCPFKINYETVIFHFPEVFNGLLLCRPLQHQPPPVEMGALAESLESTLGLGLRGKLDKGKTAMGSRCLEGGGFL
jgi:hypothetical protein